MTWSLFRKGCVGEGTYGTGCGVTEADNRNDNVYNVEMFYDDDGNLRPKKTVEYGDRGSLLRIVVNVHTSGPLCMSCLTREYDKQQVEKKKKLREAQEQYEKERPQRERQERKDRQERKKHVAEVSSAGARAFLAMPMQLAARKEHV